MEQYRTGGVFDEVQNVPELFSEIQVIVDSQQQNSMFVLSGSQNFLLLEKITQSLAGRTSIFHLYPFSQEELNKKAKTSVEERMFYGGFPRIYEQEIEPSEWFDSYVQTFIERDIRSLRNISDLDQFRVFVRMCAARSGQILDLSSLGNDCGISSNTAKAWLSLLETSFITFRLNPYYQSFNKRLIKAPKLYFWDSGLLCYLLEIQSAASLNFHVNRGNVFETYIISEIRKSIAYRGLRYPLFYWRDKVKEIDCLLETEPMRFKAIEIKSGKTFSSSYKKGIDYLRKVSKLSTDAYIIYAGENKQQLPDDIHLVSEKQSLSGFDKLLS